MAQTVAFVTGANRGLGLGLVKGFVAKPDNIVIAAVRDPVHATAQELAKISTGEGSRVIVVKSDASVEHSAFDTVKQATDHGVDHLDYVLANAGIAKGYPFVKDATRADILEHIEVNVLSVVSLYQATRDLLQKSTMKPVFAIIGSGAGALGHPFLVLHMAPPNQFSPGMEFGSTPKMSDSTLSSGSWLVSDRHEELSREGLGNRIGTDTVEKSTGGMVRVFVKGTKEQYGGDVILYTGKVQEW